MRLPAGGDVVIQFPLLACLDIACAAVARNCFTAFGYGYQLLGSWPVLATIRSSMGSRWGASLAWLLTTPTATLI